LKSPILQHLAEIIPFAKKRLLKVRTVRLNGTG